METIKISKAYPHTMKKTHYKTNLSNRDLKRACVLSILCEVDGFDGLKEVFFHVSDKAKTSAEKSALFHLISSIGKSQFFGGVIEFEDDFSKSKFWEKV